jgi:hypothetical protein
MPTISAQLAARTTTRRMRCDPLSQRGDEQRAVTAAMNPSHSPLGDAPTAALALPRKPVRQFSYADRHVSEAAGVWPRPRANVAAP